jgi:hypothetical protein
VQQFFGAFFTHKSLHYSNQCKIFDFLNQSGPVFQKKCHLMSGLKAVFNVMLVPMLGLPVTQYRLPCYINMGIRLDSGTAVV